MNSLVKKEDLDAFKKLADGESGYDRSNTLTLRNMRKIEQVSLFTSQRGSVARGSVISGIRK